MRKVTLTVDEIAAALGRQEIDASKKDSGTLTRVFSYLGGVFIFAGLCAYVAVTWEGLNSTARILITFGPGLICLILGIAAAKDTRFVRSITPLFVLGALLQTSGLFVTIYEFSTGGGDLRVAAMLIFGVMALQQWLLFTRLNRTVLLFFTLLFAYHAFMALCDKIGIPRDLTGFVCGASLISLGYAIDRTAHRSICGIIYFFGSIYLLCVGYDLLQNTFIEVLYIGVASTLIYLSTLVRSRAMLSVSTLALLMYISYFTSKHFADSIGWPITLIALGGIFYGVSSLAVRLNKRFIKS